MAQLKCPHCEHSFHAEPQMAGKFAICSSCENVIQLPQEHGYESRANSAPLQAASSNATQSDAASQPPRHSHESFPPANTWEEQSQPPRRGVLWVGAVVAGVALISLIIIMSFVSTVVRKTTVDNLRTDVQTSVENQRQLPELRLERAKKSVRKLERDLIDEKQQAARLEWTRDKIAKRVGELESELAQKKQQMLALAETVQPGDDAAKHELEDQLEAYKALDTTLQGRKEELATLNATLQKRLEGIRAMEDLVMTSHDRIDQLEARLGHSQNRSTAERNAAEMDSALRRAEAKAAIKEKMLDSHDRPMSEATTDEPARDDR